MNFVSHIYTILSSSFQFDKMDLENQRRKSAEIT